MSEGNSGRDKPPSPSDTGGATTTSGSFTSSGIGNKSQNARYSASSYSGFHTYTVSLDYTSNVFTLGQFADTLTADVYTGWTDTAIQPNEPNDDGSYDKYLPIAVAGAALGGLAGLDSLGQTGVQQGGKSDLKEDEEVIFLGDSIVIAPGIGSLPGTDTGEDTETGGDVIPVPPLGFYDGITSYLKNIYATVIGIKDVIVPGQDVFGGISDKLDEIIQKGKDLIGGIADDVTAIAVNVPDVIGGIGSRIEQLGKDLIGGIEETAAEIVARTRDVIGGIDELLETLRTNVGDAIDSGVRTIAEAIANARTWSIELGDTISKAIEDVRVHTLEGIRDLVVPDADYLSEKVRAVRSRFGFVDSIILTGQALGGAFTGFYTEPPIIYAELSNATGSFYWGDRAVVLDLRWYAQYKPTVDILISSFLWLAFVWRIFQKIPGIISGMPGDFVMDAANGAGLVDYLPSRKAGYEVHRQSLRQQIRSGNK